MHLEEQVLNICMALMKTAESDQKNTKSRTNQMSKKHVKFMLSKVPRGRLLEVEEMSSLVCWLSSEENSFSTAAIFDISGGRSTY